MSGLLTICVALVIAAGVFAPKIAPAQTAADIEAVRKAMKAAYIREDAVEPCKQADGDRFGWSKNLVLRCIYVQHDKLPNGAKKDRKAVAEAIFPEPAVIARWIVSACALLKTKEPKCFAWAVAEGQGASGFQFAITGNVLEDFPKNGTQKNYFFRNGMTVSVEPGINQSEQDLPLDKQDKLANTPNADIVSIPSGKTRYWSTTPAMFRARFPNAGTPSNLATKERRLAWLEIARREFTTALGENRNQLLEAWLCASVKQKFATTCMAAPSQ
jgi:hypothetical protein